MRIGGGEDLPENTIRLGSNAFLLKSPNPNVTDCLVIAHGGIIDKTKKFTVPAGVTIAFFVEALAVSPVPLDGLLGLMRRHILNRTAGGRAPGPFRYEAGSACPDYILQKVLGSRLFPDMRSVTTYSSVRALMNSNEFGNGPNWIPHVVTVRHREMFFTRKNIWLSKLIKQILAEKPLVKTIFCTNCRTTTSERNVDTAWPSGALNSQTGR